MKKQLLSLLFLLTLSTSICTASAIGGSADDPLVSLSYLKNTLKTQITTSLRSTLQTTTSSTQHTSAQLLMDQVRYKEGDVVDVDTGCEVVVLAGRVNAYFNGTVINVSSGAELPSGSTLTNNARYIVGENTEAAFTVVSPTAVLSCNGAASLIESSTPDYNAMANALKSLSLLQGTGTGFGSGFDLERQPTRIEAIVLFIRLLGEEQSALACTATHPFSDVPAWAEKYVAYAYAMGYSNGAGGGQFASTRTITAKEYVEFLLRALEYSSTDHTDLSTTMANAQAAGVLNRAEYDLLSSATFLRAHVVYLSYYALSSSIAGARTTLADDLIASGVFTKSAWSAASAQVKTARLS